MADVNLISGIDGTWVNPGAVEYDAGELRRADAAMFSSGGVARGLDVTVTASDVVRVEAGSWVIDGDEASEGAGVYRGGIPSQVSANLEGRDATYGRIDLVVARQYDPDVVGSHTGYQAAVEVLTGTPSANPSAPALPDLAVELAKLEVPADGGGAVAVDRSSIPLAVSAGATTPPLTLVDVGSSYTSTGFGYRLWADGRVEWEGFFTRNTGDLNNGTTQYGSFLPAEATPTSYTRFFPLLLGGGSIGRAGFTPHGYIELYVPAGVSTAVAHFNGISYFKG